MGRAIARAIRDQVIQQSLAGQSSAGIADALGISSRFVRNLLQGFRERGSEALHIHYHHCGPQKPRAQEGLVEAAKRMREEHPTWGAPLIGLKLKKQFGDEMVHARTLQRWFSQGALP